MINNILAMPLKALPLCLAALLLGCGGGSSGGSGPPVPPAQPKPPPGAADCVAWDGLFQLESASGHSRINTLNVVDQCTYIIGGFEASAHAGEARGNARGFVRKIKIGPEGLATQQWEFLLDTPASDSIDGSAIAGDSILFWGATEGSLAGDLNRGKKDAVLGSLSLDGELKKISQVGNEKPNVPLTLLPLSDWRYTLIGNDEVYVPSNYVESWEDPWVGEVAEYPAFFRLESMQNLNTPGSDFYTEAVVIDDSIVVALNSAEADRRGISIQRQHRSGELVWSLQLSESPFDNISSMQVHAGKLLVFGSTYRLLGEVAAGSADFFVAGVDPNSGELVGLQQFGTQGPDWARQLIVTPMGLIALGEVSDDQGNWSALLYRLDPNGKPVAHTAFRLGESMEVRSGSLADDALIVAGSFRKQDGRRVGFLRRLVSSELP